MGGNDSIFAGSSHTFHVCEASESQAACGDRGPRNWLIRRDWMNRLLPEMLCPRCLAVLHERDGMTPTDVVGRQ
jgi:hypothetical protein